MRTRGNRAIGAVVISPGTPVARAELSAPVLTATTRSSSPRIFHHEGLAGREAGLPDESDQDPRRGDSDRDIAEPGGPGEDAGQHPIGVQGQKPQSGEPPRLYPLRTV